MDFKNVLAGVGGMCILMIVVIVGMFTSANYSNFDNVIYTQNQESGSIYFCGYKEDFSSNGISLFGDVSFDQNGFIYSLGKDNISNKNKVFIFDKSNNQTSFGDFKDPRALYLYTENTNKYLFVSDYGTGEVQVFNENNNNWFKKKTWVAPTGFVFLPTLMDYTKDSKGVPYLLVLNEADHSVARININEMKDTKSSKAEISTFITNSSFSNLVGITISSGRLFLADNNGVDKNTIFKYNILDMNNPLFQKSWGKQGAKEGEFNSISDISNNGNTLYVSDVGHGKIILFDFEGKFIANMQGNFSSENKYQNLRNLSFYPAQKYLYTTTIDGNIRKIGTECFYLKVRKDVLPVRSSQDFDFNIVGLSFFTDNFTLDDDLDPLLPSVSPTIALAPIYDSYSITEKLVSGYDVSYKCTYGHPTNALYSPSEKIGKGNTFNLKPERTYTPDQEIGSNVYCIVYNEKFDSEIIIKKDWIPGFSENLFSFSISSQDIASVKYEINLDDNPNTSLPNISDAKKLVSQRLYKVEEITTSGIPMSTSFSCIYYKYDQNKRDYVFNRAQRGNGAIVEISPALNERIICTFNNCDFGGDCLAAEGPVPTKDLLQ